MSKPVVRSRSQLDSLLGPGNYGRIARLSGTSPEHVSRVCRGLRGTSLIAAHRIAEAAGVTLDELYRYVSTSSTFVATGRKTQRQIEQIVETALATH